MKLSNQQAEALASQIVSKNRELREAEEKAYYGSKSYKEAILKDTIAIKKELPSKGISLDFTNSLVSNYSTLEKKIKDFVETKHRMKDKDYKTKHIASYNNDVKRDLIVASIGVDDINTLLKEAGYTL